MPPRRRGAAPPGGGPPPTLLPLLGAASACTLVEVPAGDGVVAIARTMEEAGSPWAPAADPPQGYHAVAHPKGTQFRPSPLCPLAEGWSSAQRYVAIEQPLPLASRWACDGVNDAGLAVHEQTLREAGYQHRGADGANICFADFVSWALGRFSSVPELVSELEQHTTIIGGAAPDAQAVRVHWAVADAERRSIVVEFIGGVLRVHNNTVGVMTNDPPFDWHLRNLNNFVTIGPRMPPPPAVQYQTEVGAVPRDVGHGFNLAGLPGDASPPSRFVRMFYLRELALRSHAPPNASAALVIATQLLNAVAIAKGQVARVGTADTSHEFTQYGSVKMPQLRRLYFRSYSNMQWRLIDLTRLPSDSRANVSVFSGGLGVRDITEEL